MRAYPPLLVRILCVAVAVLLGACAGTVSDFDRVAPPMRFAEVRETASWVEGFDDGWWAQIDAAYAQYDLSFDADLVARWDAFCADAALERLRGQTPDARRARSMWARHLEIDRALAQRERAFHAALEDTLPREAAPFIELLAARTAFHRASGILREPGQRLPGPLEVMQLVRRREMQADAVRAAAAAYTRLAGDAESAVRARTNAYIETCADMEQLIAARLGAEGAEREAADDAARATAKAAREVAEAACDRRTKEWERESARIVERLRLSLQREGRVFAQAIEDPEDRSTYLDQLDFVLHDGIRAAKGIDAFARIARAALSRTAEAGGGSAESLAQLDALVEQEISRQRTARVALSSGSPAARRKAYEELQKIGDPVGEFVGKALAAHGGVWRVLERTTDVMAGVQSAEEAAALVTDPPPAPPERPSPFVPPGRDRNMQLLFSSPLVPSALAALSQRLELPPESQQSFDALVERESKALAESGEAIGSAMIREFEKLDPSVGGGETKVRVRRFMGSLASLASRQRSADSAANERVLAEAARLAGVAADDERVEIARLELDLWLEIGVDRATREAEPVAGAVASAIANPLELARIAARDEGERAAAEGVLLRHAAQLRAAHRDLAAEIRRNLADFLVFAVESQESRSVSGGWRPSLAGREAVRMRLELVDEFRLAIGDAFAERFEQELREIVAPECEPRAPAAFAALERVVRGRKDEGNGGLEAIIGEAGMRRSEALREFMVWRARWVRIGDYEGRDSWNGLERTGPRGWLIRSRAADAIERALARAAPLLDEAAVEETGLRRFPVAMPRRLRPHFE